MRLLWLVALFTLSDRPLRPASWRPSTNIYLPLSLNNSARSGQTTFQRGFLPYRRSYLLRAPRRRPYKYRRMPRQVVSECLYCSVCEIGSPAKLINAFDVPLLLRNNEHCIFLHRVRHSQCPCVAQHCSVNWNPVNRPRLQEHHLLIVESNWWGSTSAGWRINGIKGRNQQGGVSEQQTSVRGFSNRRLFSWQERQTGLGYGENCCTTQVRESCENIYCLHFTHHRLGGKLGKTLSHGGTLFSYRLK